MSFSIGQVPQGRRVAGTGDPAGGGEVTVDFGSLGSVNAFADVAFGASIGPPGSSVTGRSAAFVLPASGGTLRIIVSDDPLPGFLGVLANGAEVVGLNDVGRGVVLTGGVIGTSGLPQGILLPFAYGASTVTLGQEPLLTTLDSVTDADGVTRQLSRFNFNLDPRGVGPDRVVVSVAFTDGTGAARVIPLASALVTVSDVVGFEQTAAEEAIVGAMLVLGPAGPAHAILLSLEPSTQTVAPGDTVSVDLTVSGLGDLTAPSLSTWDVDIAFDPAILAFTGATFGTQLALSGLGSIGDALDLGSVVDVFEVSFDDSADLDAPQAGAFTLATLSFDALAAGTSALTLTVDILGDSLVKPLAADVAGASVTVVSPSSSVPGPPTLALLGGGLAGLALLRRCARRRRRPRARALPTEQARFGGRAGDIMPVLSRWGGPGAGGGPGCATDGLPTASGFARANSCAGVGGDLGARCSPDEPASSPPGRGGHRVPAPRGTVVAGAPSCARLRSPGPTGQRA